MASEKINALRIRNLVDEIPGISEKQMFGGIAYLLNGNMACGIHKDHLVVRVGKENYQESLNRKHVREFDITGRSMKGWIMILPKGYENDDELKFWVKKGIDFAKSLPKK